MFELQKKEKEDANKTQKYEEHNDANLERTKKQKEDGQTSTFDLVQIESFDELPFNIPVDSRLNCVNGLFCIWESLSMQFATIINAGIRDIRFLPNLNDDFIPFTIC
ncbi:hypothetical protein H5410_000605 [Solanum commersonii]|uniref:Uncharacterized protein n=1 Tax=Solanum commersonii TaxID=4109 RepID=A0A9J6AWN5_SOLCO|nr:hypothetical protein H5410_000605 [Solanum commersonii]